MRFAMVTTFYPPYNFGGDGMFIRRLSHALARRGHTVDIIIDAEAYETLSGESEVAPLEEPEGVTLHALRSGRPRLSTLLTQQLGRPVFNSGKIEEILGDHFDVINYHNISLVGGPGVLKLGKGLKVYTTHEHWLVCQSHILWRHNREVCDGRECIRFALAHKRPPQAWRASSILDEACAHVDAFFTLSQSCADNHKHFGFKFPMTVIPSFLPDEEAKEEGEVAEMAPRERPFFLFVGRLSRIKGLQDVIPLIENADSFDLVVAGAGGDEAMIRLLAEGRKNVHFLGHCRPSQLRKLYRQALAVVVPSRCYEVFPMVVLEAFREGTPVIARRLGPFPEIIDHSQGGLLFENDGELRNALNRLSEEPQSRSEMGASALSAFESTWSERVAIDKYLTLVQEMVEKKDN